VRPLSNTRKGLLILAGACLWFVACLALSSPYGDTYIMSRVWLVTACTLPAAFALGGALLQEPPRKMICTSAIVRWGLSVAVVLSSVFAYVVCAGVIGNIASICAHIGYEGGTSMSLNTGRFLALRMALFALAVFSLHRWAPVRMSIGEPDPSTRPQ